VKEGLIHLKAKAMLAKTNNTTGKIFLNVMIVKIEFSRLLSPLFGIRARTLFGRDFSGKLPFRVFMGNPATGFWGQAMQEKRRKDGGSSVFSWCCVFVIG
jgi:hypothetical protein